jgi:D-serine deaminase-like pyridoxal phosphate-dependent protein
MAGADVAAPSAAPESASGGRTTSIWRYEPLKALLQGERLPLVVVDLDVFDANVRRLAGIAGAHGKLLRPAAKSIRVPDLLKRVLEVGAPHVRGVMCYSVEEAALLARHGFDDLLVAYPTVQPSDVALAWHLVHEGATLRLMVDAPVHAELLARAWRARASRHEQARPLELCIDVDLSWRPLGRHVGVQRSPVRTLDDFLRVVDAIAAEPELRLAGVMGYEAQIAGLGDENPFAPLLNPAKKMIKRWSAPDVAARREAIARALDDRGVRLTFFNGGGTGSIRTTSEEPWITEVTAGSGFLQSHLFDYYATNENEPAYCFALQVTRSSQPDHVTCHSGGFIASGPTDADKAPVPFLPVGLKATANEGFGEVQTPLVVPPELRGTLAPGDPVFFRPAKAGELAERFNEYLLKRGDQIVGRAKTYRGLGCCFH